MDGGILGSHVDVFTIITEVSHPVTASEKPSVGNWLKLKKTYNKRYLNKTPIWRAFSGTI